MRSGTTLDSTRVCCDYTVGILKASGPRKPPLILSVCIWAYSLICCLSMTQFTHWALFDSAAAAAVVAAVGGYRPPPHHPTSSPIGATVLIGKVPASSRCGDPLRRGTLLNPRNGTSQHDGDQNGKCDRARPLWKPLDDRGETQRRQGAV